jgi:hypothetical protein
MDGLGRYVHPEIGVNVRATTHAAADYISKWGAASELTKSSLKIGQEVAHYTPFDLLYLYGGEGKKWAGDAFKEYAGAMRGVNQIRWSKGLRKLLGLGLDVTDSELVESPEEDDSILAQLTIDQWKIILKHDKRGELLAVADTGDKNKLRVWLMAMGVFLE